MAPVTVRIVDVSYVSLPAEAALPPGDLKLNAMEVQWLVLPLLQHLLFFEGDQLPPFDTVVQSLQCSLAATLSYYAPLAGKLVHLADTGDVAIRCSASDDGVRFVVAESEADVRRLAGDEEHDVQTFERLVPELDMTELPAPLLAVQATRLEGAGWLSGSPCTTPSPTGGRCGSSWRRGRRRAGGTHRPCRLRASIARVSGCTAARSWPVRS